MIGSLGLYLVSGVTPAYQLKSVVLHPGIKPTGGDIVEEEVLQFEEYGDPLGNPDGPPGHTGFSHVELASHGC
jgi:hypothetical protein